MHLHSVVKMNIRW